MGRWVFWSLCLGLRSAQKKHIGDTGIINTVMEMADSYLCTHPVHGSRRSNASIDVITASFSLHTLTLIPTHLPKSALLCLAFQRHHHTVRRNTHSPAQLSEREKTVKGGRKRDTYRTASDLRKRQSRMPPLAHGL